MRQNVTESFIRVFFGLQLEYIFLIPDDQETAAARPRLELKCLPRLFTMFLLLYSDTRYRDRHSAAGTARQRCRHFEVPRPMI